MSTFPYTKEDQDAGKQLISSDKVQDVFFSEGTYQVLVSDGEEYWPFYQITDDGGLTDSFCTCEKAESGQSCPHLAAGYIVINRIPGEPIHVRYRDSLGTISFILPQKGTVMATRQSFLTKKKESISPIRRLASASLRYKRIASKGERGLKRSCATESKKRKKPR